MNAQLSSNGVDWFAQTLERNQERARPAQPTVFDLTRNIAQQRLPDLTAPHRRQEDWRYTDLSELYKKIFSRPDPVTSSHSANHTYDDWVYTREESYRLVFENGQFVAGLSDCISTDKVFIGNLNQLPESFNDEITRLLSARQAFADDAFSEMNRALMQDGLLIYVKANYALDKPVEVVYLNSPGAKQLLIQPRNLVVLESGSTLKLIQLYTGVDSAQQGGYFFNGLTQLELGENAQLSHFHLQRENNAAFHISRVAVNQQTGSVYDALNLCTGAHWSRTDINARFNGEYARSTINGLYSVNEAQYNDIHLDVQHLNANCQSEQQFKGLLLGAGRAVFDGRILVAKDAQKTDARLSNKNLMLAENAEIDTKPQLEIYADDVKCSHGTTVGKIDPAQLFYLRSRGIQEKDALRMLCMGFAHELIAAIDDERLHAFMHRQMTALFGQSPVVGDE